MSITVGLIPKYIEQDYILLVLPRYPSKQEIKVGKEWIKIDGWIIIALPHHTSAKHPAPSFTSSSRELLAISQASWVRPTVSGV